MKVLKAIITAIFLLQTVVSFGQTKEETISWLKDKFEKYAIGHPYGKATVKDIKLVSVDACQFIFSCIYTEEADVGTPHQVTTTFPTDIVGIDEWGYFDYGADSKSDEGGVKKVIQILDGKKQFRGGAYAMVKIHLAGEEKLRERLEKAIKHLATFCEKKKETF